MVLDHGQRANQSQCGKGVHQVGLGYFQDVYLQLQECTLQWNKKQLILAIYRPRQIQEKGISAKTYLWFQSIYLKLYHQYFLKATHILLTRKYPKMQMLHILMFPGQALHATVHLQSSRIAA